MLLISIKKLFNSENNRMYIDLVVRIFLQLITHADKEYLTTMPQSEEIKNVVHNMDDNSTLDLD